MMPETPTPGQVAYEAYWGERHYPTRRCWQDVRPVEQQRWEAAAQAVLASWLQEQGWLGNTAWLGTLRERGESIPLPAGEEGD
jgi:hypothetical protein